MRTAALLLIFSCLAVSAAVAETIPISESFKGTSMPAGFNPASTAAGRQIELSETLGALFGANAAEDNGRNYIRTNDTNYHTVSFVTELTIKADTSGGGTWPLSEQFFFGLGTGSVGQYGVPDRPGDGNPGYPSIFFEFNPATGNDARRWRVTRVHEVGGVLTLDENFWGPVDYPGGVTTAVHRLQLTYDAAAKTVQFSVHYDYAGGPFVASQSSATLDVSNLYDLWDAGASSSIFFGGDSRVTTDPAWATNLTVVPEPATLTLAVLGLLALATGGRRWNRRRR